MSHATHNGLLTTTAAISAVYAVAFLVAPGPALALFDLDANASAIWVTRLLGAVSLGFAATAFLARRILDMEARRAVDGGFLVMNASLLGVLMWAQYLQVMNTLGWINVVVTGGLAIAYFYFIAGEDRFWSRAPARPA